MKRKTSLVLMEQAVMLLVLAVAAALCLRAFVWADVRSLENANRDRALTEIQTAAEVLKANRGDYAAAAEVLGIQPENGTWRMFWDENWERCAEPGDFELRLIPEESDVENLGCASVEVTRHDGTVLGSLRVCWQEVAP